MKLDVMCLWDKLRKSTIMLAMSNNSDEIQNTNQETSDIAGDQSSGEQAAQSPSTGVDSPQRPLADMPLLEGNTVGNAVGNDCRYSLRDIQKNRQRLKRLPPTNNFFYFILYDYWQIKRFGVQSSLLVSQFPFRLRFHSKIGEQFEKVLIQEVIIPLKARLKIILEKAWLHLGKFEYNLIALLDGVCKECEKPGFVRMNAGNKFTAETFRNLEPLLLVFYQRPNLVKRLLNVLSFAHDNMRGVKFSQRETRVMVEKLLLFNAMRPSLAQFILASNMMYCRRILKMQDIVETVEDPLVSELEFDAQQSVQQSIFGYLDEIDKNLAALYSSYVGRQSERFFMPCLDAHTPDITMLRKFLTGKTGPEIKGLYADMYRNIPSYVIDFSNRYIEDFEPLLCKPVVLKEKGSVQIFSEQVFADFFSRLQFNLDQIKRLRNQIPFFQILRYLELTKSKKRISSYVQEPSALEKQLLTHLENHISIISGLKDKLLSLATILTETGEANVQKDTDLRGSPTGNFELHRLRAGVISNKQLEGKTLGEAVRMGVILLNLYLYELNEHSVLAGIEEETKLRSQIQSQLQLTQRLGSREQNFRFKQKYLIDKSQ